MTSENDRLDLAHEFSKYTEVFVTPHTGFEVNIYYLPFFVIQRVLHQSHHLFIFHMVVSEPEFRRQIDRYRRMVPSPLKRLVKQKLAGNAIRKMLGVSDRLRRWQDAGAKFFHLCLGHMSSHLNPAACR
jgi:hypothetical protein